MGTDIHSIVEVEVDGRWEPMFEKVWPNARAEDHTQIFARVPIIARHYGLFSVLADVRNQTGRGTKTMMKQIIPEYGEIEFEYDTDDGGHDPLTPIAVPRGIPDDASPVWKRFASQGMMHDPSFLLLEELEDTDLWDQVLYEQAVVMENEYVEWLASGKMPETHARGVGGPGMRIVTEVEYAAGVRGEQTAVDFRWKGNTVRDDVEKSWWATVAMMRIVSGGRKVRLMICFDS